MGHTSTRDILRQRWTLIARSRIPDRMNHTTSVFEEAASTSIRIATVDVEGVLLIGVFGILITKVCIWPVGVATPILD